MQGEDRTVQLAWAVAYCIGVEIGLSPESMRRLRELVIRKEPRSQPRDGPELIASAAWLVTEPDVSGNTPGTKNELRNSELMQISENLGSPRVGVLLGGATKIKQYVLESAKLPEIRGASGLLDRINRLDVPALFGECPDWLEQCRCTRGPGDPELAEAEQLVRKVRDWFRVVYGVEPLECDECVVYAGGGEVLALVPPRIAPLIADAIERIYTKETLVANSVAAWRSCSLLELRFGLRPLEFWQDDLGKIENGALKRLFDDYWSGQESPKVFGEITAWLALERTRRREGNVVDARRPKPPPHLETIPYARRCGSCDRRGGVVRLQGATGASEWLCEPCARKRVLGQRLKRGKAPGRWYTEAGFPWEPFSPSSWSAEFDAWLEQHETFRKQYYGSLETEGYAQPPEDLDAIGVASRPEKFIGAVYSDGNGMGDLLGQMRTISQYAAFSTAISRAVKEATFRALARNLHPYRPDSEDGPIHPFEILGLGGDDVFLIVPGHAALSAAASIEEEVQRILCEEEATRVRSDFRWEEVQRVRRRAERGEDDPGDGSAGYQSRVGFSSGVVVADQRTPVFLLRDLCEQLLKTAKARAARLRERRFYGGTVDFVVLKSTSMIATAIREFREAALKKSHRKRVMYLTAKPYTVAELRALIDAVRTLKAIDFPRSQLLKLRKRLESGWLVATVDYLYAIARLRPEHRQVFLESVEGVWTGRGDGWAFDRVGPWMPREPKAEGSSWELETVLADLIEIYDFVEEGGSRFE